ncbi:MAG: alpha/beta hydrolase, partial [Pseudomonadota bacterium]
GGHAVGYAEAGEGPLVIFAHCSLGHSGLWKGVMSALAPEWRCVALDLPGHGKSDRGDQSISLQDQASDDVAAAAARFGDGAAHVVGLSLGGAVMARTAARRPNVARSATLIEPIMMQLLSDDPSYTRPEGDDVMRPVVLACRDERYEDAAAAFMDGWGQAGQFAKMPADAQASIGRAMRWVYEDFGMAHDWIPGQVSREEIAAIACPVRLMQGETTRPSAKSVVKSVAALIPGAEAREIANAGHLSPVTHPRQVAEEIAAFLAQTEAAQAA